jgi:transposase
MHFVGIDQHKRHLTICVRNEQGNIVMRRQVSTEWEHVDPFLASLQDGAAAIGGYMAVMEVCGFNDWLVKRLNQYGCARVLVISAPERARQKTDRRDAARLSELLWINRDRIAAGERLMNIAEVYQPTERERDGRQLTHIRHRLGSARTRTMNSIQGILRRHNLEQARPTKGAFTKAALAWLRGLDCLPDLDSIELTMRLAEFDLFTKQLAEVTTLINQRAAKNDDVRLLRTMPRPGAYTALALVSHIGSIKRFPHARSLSNYFGLTPGCRNSGETDRPGSITKAGHPLPRFLLAQMVLHALRGDPGLREWYSKVKRRRGSKVARVAVMRKLCESMWHMLSKKEKYIPVNSRGKEKQPKGRRRSAA